ncbi:MAG: hypothetical protein JST69_09785 [Bacteroidetes bacterium]|nr:hypothetical protein [Bacteroidota bacterium]
MDQIKKYLLCLLVSFCSWTAFAQAAVERPDPVVYDKLSFGIGLGLDYGGIGANLMAYPHKNIGLFFGGGYALAGFGYNTGAKIRIITQSRVHPYFIGMYGYNAAFVVSNATQYNKLFYSPTIGFGIDSHSRRSTNGYWSVALMIPLRGSEIDDYISYLKTQGISLKNSLSPVGLSVGYHFVIN